MAPIKQLTCTLQGALVLLDFAGNLWQQRPAEGEPNKKIWHEVSLDGIDETARIVEIVARPSGHDGQLVARLNDGRLFEQHQPQRGPYGSRSWRELPGPEDGAP